MRSIRRRHHYRPGVRRILAMEIVSGVGDGAFWVALTSALLDRGAGPGVLALAAVARLGPRALISAPAGVIADRVDRRRLLTTLDLGRAALMALLAAAASREISVFWMLTIVLATYSLAAPYRPALTAAMPLVAGESDLSSANALVGTVRQVMTFIGPLCGALLLEIGSASVGFAVNAATFLIASMLMASTTELATPRRAVSLRTMTDERRAWSQDMADGWQEVRSHAGLMTVTILVFVMYATRGAEIPLHILIAKERLGLGAPGIGLLAGAIGLGALVTLPLSDRIAQTRRPASTMALSVAVSAAGMILLAPIRSATLTCIVLVFVGSALVAFEVLSIVLLQRLARLSTLGRVFGIVNSASNAGKLIGALAAPTAVALFGLSRSLVAIGATTGVVTLASVPGLRRLSYTVSERRDQLGPIVDVLRSLSIFEAASTASLERLAASIEVESPELGRAVVIQGEPADDLFIVRGGRFRVLDGPVELNHMTAGDWFGEIGLLQNGPRSASVVAASPGSLWRIPGDVFLLALNDQAAPPTALIDAMSDRLARSRVSRAGGEVQQGRTAIM
ncbi:MAG: MFS transporter [Acidimicrobiia bacterium]